MASTYVAGVFLTISTYRGPFLAYNLFDSSVAPTNFKHIKTEEEEIEWSDDECSSINSDNLATNMDDMDNPLLTEELPHNLDKEFFAELLSPPRSMCNKRFSFSVDDWVFVGAPVHILDSGTWRTVKENVNIDQVCTEKDSPMRMFHICFVINPPINETKVCEERIYRFILAPFVKILRNEQALNNYVWRQSIQMMNAKDQNSRAQSTPCELAKSLKTLLFSVKNMEIANISINGKLRSFQIPSSMESDQLPSWFDTDYTGRCLSSCNVPSKEIGHQVFDCYGLLLLDSPEAVIQEIRVDPKSPIGGVIMAIDPSLSIAKLGQKMNIDSVQMSNLMMSLVYWRKARIIIPLNVKYTYALSPLAPLESKIKELATSFRALYPTMPPLQKLLRIISLGKPKPLIMHLPSPDHRDAYMNVLPFLLRNDLLVHLSTFVLIVITRKIKIAAIQAQSGLEEKTKVSDSDHGHSHSGHSSNHSPSHSKTQTEINNSELKYDQFHNGAALNTGDMTNALFKLNIEEIKDTIIQDPRNCTPIEKMWLRQLIKTKSPESSALFNRLSKYFNGKDCLEQIMIREDIHGEKMKEFLAEYSQCLVTYKHW